MWDALERIAAANDVSVGQIIRGAMSRDIQRRAGDLACAQSWEDLQTRLFAKGYRLAEAGDGLILQTRETGARLCKASEIGYSYSALLRRFDCVFPGHAHTAPLRRIRGH